MGIVTEASKFFSLVKFSHTVFAMPFALLGYFTAIYSHGYGFDLQILILVVLCVIFARNAAMGFNRYVDRYFDKQNPRTADREIPANKLSTRKVLIFVLINSIAFIIAAWFINFLCFILSPIALLIILGYSYTKTFTWFCHIILGLGLALSPTGAYIAVTAQFNIIAVLYSLIVLFWVAGFDIIYAINDVEFDKKNKLFSIPSYFGRKKSLIISVTLHFFSVLLLLAVAVLENFNVVAATGCLVFVLFLIIQHYQTLIKRNYLNATLFIYNGLASILLSIGIIVEMIIFYY